MLPTSSMWLLAILLLLCILDAVDALVSLSMPISIRQRTWSSLFASSSDMNMNTKNNPLLDVWTDEARDDIATEVAELVEFPFPCPEPIVELATGWVVDAIATKLSKDLVRQIGEVVGMSIINFELDDLAEKVTAELNTQIDLPFLDETQEDVVLKKITKTVLQVLAKKDVIVAKRSKIIVNQSVATAQTLLGDEAGRRKLALVLNTKMNFPFLDEHAEEELLLRSLEACSEQLLRLLPPELIGVLKGQSSQGLGQTKEIVVKRMNESVDMVGLNEDQEAWLLQNLVDVVVDLLIDELIDETEAELLLMNPTEQRQELSERQAIVQRKLRLSKRRFENKQSYFQAKLERIQQRMLELGE
jgi:hypothetical protein